MLRLTATQTALHARHLTGSLALPAGREAFRVEAREGDAVGEHFGSSLPYGWWPNAAPCRLVPYHTDLSRRALDEQSLALDIDLGSLASTVRVPLKRVPAAAHVVCDVDGFVRANSLGLEQAQTAVAQAAFEDARTGG